jgi:hypothetical protein
MSGVHLEMLLVTVSIIMGILILFFDVGDKGK